MAPFTPRTVRESLYWSYANLAMAFTGGRHNESTYQQVDYIVRNKTYYGLLRGTLKIGSLLIDEREKLSASDACCYCGCQSDLTLDHLIPQFRGGEHSADNLVRACRSCNSSKKSLDLLEWMSKRGEFPPLVLLRRYLKLAIGYCTENGLLDIMLEPREGASPKQRSLFNDPDVNTNSEQCEGASPAWPFAIGLIPHKFPDPVDLVGRVPSEEQERAHAEWAAACGPMLLAAEKQWQTFSASKGYILAIYKKGQKTIVDVLRVTGAYIQGQRKKTLKLHVVAPRIKRDKVFGDYLDTGRVFEIPIHKLLYTETVPPTFRRQGLPAYRQLIERGLTIAEKLQAGEPRGD